MVIQTIFNLLAGVASMFGLYYSIRGFLQAREATKAAGEASEAAKQARAAVQESNAVEELRQISELAKAMKNQVQDSEWRTARFLSSELIHRISFAEQRWKYLTPDPISTALENAVGRVNMVSRAIPGDGANLSDNARSRMNSACHEIVVELARVSGWMQQKLEGK
jgi:hypothetical protein